MISLFKLKSFSHNAKNKMPYIQRGGTQVPYNVGPFIQRGSGIFSTLGNLASRYVFPWLARTAKTTSSALASAAKSQAVKRLANKAKQAAVTGVLEAGSQILDGHNVGKVLKTQTKNTANKLTDAIKDEAKITSKKLKRMKNQINTGVNNKTDEIIKPPPTKKKKLQLSKTSKRFSNKKTPVLGLTPKIKRSIL